MILNDVEILGIVAAIVLAILLAPKIWAMASDEPGSEPDYRNLSDDEIMYKAVHKGLEKQVKEDKEDGI